MAACAFLVCTLLGPGSLGELYHLSPGAQCTESRAFKTMILFTSGFEKNDGVLSSTSFCMELSCESFWFWISIASSDAPMAFEGMQ